MRVSHRNIYDNVLGYMNRSLSNLVELNLQASSQKKVNRPSDDPIGMSRILSYRDSLASMTQYRQNIDTAQGWNGLADENLMQVSVVITRLKELAEQASTGTMSAANREQISIEARQLFDQLITLSNASYEGKYIYAGHKTDKLAFERTLFAQSNDDSITSTHIREISGGASSTILVQFLDSGKVGEVELEYRYSKDGGKTWTEATLPESAPPASGNPVVMDLGGTRVTLNPGAEVTGTARDNKNDTTGTWLWVRPSAIYQGDDEQSIAVDKFVSNVAVTASAQGTFSNNTMVRIDDDPIPTPGPAANITFSYSTDGGRSWVTGRTAPYPNGEQTSLPLPGGFLDLSDNLAPPGHAPLSVGDQFIIRPSRALMHVEISQGETIQINNIGKDVFGGLYPDPTSRLNQPVELRGKASNNLFETVGKLVGYLETNTQQGAQQALADLNDAHGHITTYLGGVGARRNRLDIADNILYGLQLNATERKSYIEDIDVAELMTKLHMQQINYEAVLRSSTTIMKMSLVNFM